MAGSGIVRTRILSHGRSGTVYTSKVWQAMGLDIKHERDGKDGAVGGIFFKGTQDLSSYRQIWHQVRNPIKVISESTTCRARSFVLMFREIGYACQETDPLRRAMISWLAYTEWADKIASWTYRIEDMDILFREMCERLGIPNARSQSVPEITKKTNYRDYAPSLTFEDLYSKDPKLADKVYDRAVHYGYENFFEFIGNSSHMEKMVPEYII